MIGPEITVPDFTEAVVGYRQFALKQHAHNFRLVSPHQGEPWLTRTMTARCTLTVKVPEGVIVPGPVRQHEAPQKDCSCGIYAYFDPCPVESAGYEWRYDDTKVEALMTMEGRIEVHSRGMRAQRATICALGTNATLTPDERAGLVQLAQRLGVPVVPQEELPKLASEYGRELPENQRPETDDEAAAQPGAIPVYPASGFKIMSTATTPIYGRHTVTSVGSTRLDCQPPWWLIGGYAAGAALLLTAAAVFSVVWPLWSALVWVGFAAFFYGKRTVLA